MRILFMGTPDLSRTVLRALCGAGHDIVLAVTQPDRAKGRSKALQFSPVKEEALARGIPLFQPEKLRTEENTAFLKAFLAEHPADVGVVAAFGQILTEEVLRLPRFGCLNVHTSLLPLYRGASPIEAAILAGESVTGVTVMQMDAGIDTGDILLQREVCIDPEDTGGSLTEKLAEAGGELIVQALAALKEGTLKACPQEGSSSYAGLIRKEQGLIDWFRDAKTLERQIRAFTPWPGSYTFRDGKRLKVLTASAEPAAAGGIRPGSVLSADKNGILMMTGNGLLRITALQPEGKREMSVAEYLRGYALKPGTVLGEKYE